MTHERSNISSDLLWEIVRKNNAYLVKRNAGGGVQFSRDPFNLTNKHSKTHAGFINDKAVSIQPGENGGMTLQTKKSKGSHKPASQYNSHSYGKTKSNQKIYKTIADSVGQKSYRGDLNRDAISRASHLKDAQRGKKDKAERKPRGAAAKKAVE